MALAVESPGFHYPNAPIAEAVFDVRVAELGGPELSRVMSFADDGYPTRQESTLSGAEVESGPLGVTTRAIRKMNGLRLTSEDGRQIAQLRTDGFSFSRLAPYEDWSTFFAEARRLWCSYVDVAQPGQTTRFAVRYINQIVVPPGSVSIDDYLRTRPEISDDMPTATSGFFLTLDIPLPMFGATVRIIETVLAPNEEDPRPRLVLDIDAFREVDEPAANDAAAMSRFDTVFQDLRNAKNLVFEASITDRARELFR